MARESTNYPLNVFINCPFDQIYQPLMEAVVFTIYDCGFIPRCALEEDNGGSVRVEKIKKLIEASQYGIHDISRTEVDELNGLPRFNMPLELGVFLGAIFFGNKKQQSKNALILDRESYRYQKFISDIAGHDIKAHNSDPEVLIKLIRNWLHNARDGKAELPGAAEMVRRFNRFKNDLPEMCLLVKKDIHELTFLDRSMLISSWLDTNPLFS